MNFTAYLVVGLCAALVIVSAFLVLVACMLASKLSKKGIE